MAILEQIKEERQEKKEKNILRYFRSYLGFEVSFRAMDDETFQKFSEKILSTCGVQDEFDKLLEEVKNTMKLQEDEQT